MQLERFRSYSKNIQSILVWNILFCFGLGIHLVLYNLYLEGIVQDDAMIGKIIGLNFLAQALIYIPAGLFSDRVGSKKGVIVGVILFTIALVGNLFASTPDSLSFWGFMIGIGHAASIVTFVPLLTEYSNSEEKKNLFTFAFSTGTLFTFLGTLLGGIFSDGFQTIFDITQTESMRLTLGFTILIFVFCLIPLLFVKKNALNVSSKKQTSIFSIIKNKPGVLLPLMKFSTSKVFAGVSLGIISPFLNLFFMHKFSLTPSNISFVLAAGTLATVIFMSYNSKITNRISEVKTVSLYHLISIPAIILLGWTQSIWIAIVAFIIFRSANFGLNPIVSKLMMDGVDQEIRGLTNSFGFMAQSICISLLGPISMYIVQIAGTEKGYFLLCLISAAGSLIAGVYFLYAFGQKKNQLVGKMENQPV
ncbi:MFS transporter [Cytobacillus sp. FJAT-54145]|uniref:MFS transporter n=1 Tax=Cytobacillus spartinae TaxID=3299023 RepID=A0ABW6KD13_9BACI